METTLDQFIEDNPIRDTMLWKSSAEDQFRRFQVFAYAHGAKTVTVVSSHRSKSIDLPVVRLEFEGGSVTIRDNFFDLNLLFEWHSPVYVPLSKMYPAFDWDWYLNQIDRKRKYTYEGWSDEQMDDPDVLCVTVTRKRGSGTYESMVNADAKHRWIRRMDTPEWYRHDWSSSRLLVEGPMGPGCTFYRAETAFGQGIVQITDLTHQPVYEPGKDTFVVACGWERAGEILSTLTDNTVRP